MIDIVVRKRYFVGGEAWSLVYKVCVDLVLREGWAEGYELGNGLWLLSLLGKEGGEMAV